MTHGGRSYHVNSHLVPFVIKGALSERTSIADTVPPAPHWPLVHHDRSSVRQKRPRSRVDFCAVLTYACLIMLSFVAANADAQQRPPKRDSTVVPANPVAAPNTVSAPPAPEARKRMLQPPYSLPPKDGAALSPGIRALLLSDRSTYGTVLAPLDARTLMTRLVRQPDAAAAARRREVLERALSGSHAIGAIVSDANSTPLSELLSAAPELSVRLNSQLESRVQRSRNDRCSVLQYRAGGSNCAASWTPDFNFQFDVVSNGMVGDRVHVDLDYNSRNEYGSSNEISVRYQGKPGQFLERVEVGNISFLPPPSRFISSGIPSGNYGVLASGKIGSMSYTGVAAQQKGNVSKDRTFIMGDRTVQQQSRALEDVGMELRRFFLTVDPRQFSGYPNIDILNRAQMLRLAASLPDSVRPARLYIYKQLVGATNPNPRGPQLSVRGARNSTRQIYEVLRENVDYYVDPSQLWIALVAPLAGNERLAVAYEVNVNGVPGRNIGTGGTPDVEFTPATQYANLLWEPELQPTDPNGYFQREIKSVYRLGGDEIQRESITLRVVTGTSGDQEKPRDTSRGATYLQLFGLAQLTNPGAFDAENRVWPRPQDPNKLAGAPTSPLIRDNYVVFPSLQPFARAGLAQPFANPANDTLYTYPNEYLYSTQRPQSIFRLQSTYLTEGRGEANTLELGTLQIRPMSERVTLDGRLLRRDVDYTTNYDLGVINFKGGDTLFLQPRQVVVRFEDNQSFTSSPTAIFGLTTQLPVQNGSLSFTAISQQQRSSYNRPPLGFESAGSLVAGMTANFNWDATALTRAINRLPFTPSATASRIGMLGEFALSRPQPNAAGQAYLEAFESSAGRTVSLPEAAWALSSRPAQGAKLLSLLGGTQLTLDRNTTLVFQNLGLDPLGAPQQFTIDQIDPRVTLRGSGVQTPEQVLWLTLNPLRVGGLPGIAPGTTLRRNAWTVGNTSAMGPTPTGRRWGSIRTVLNPSGDDLSRVENIEFFALVQIDPAKRARNPTLILDFGDISENRVAFAPETLLVAAPIRPGLAPDTTYRGKRLAGYDRLDSERDPFSRSFNAVNNDVGIAGSIADSIIVVDRSGGDPSPHLMEKVPICSADVRRFLYLGDSRANCTVRNNRLDEEDIDLDGQLNLSSTDTDREQWKRFAVDLSDARNWSRTGKCRTFVTDSQPVLGVVSDTLCWVQVRLNWRSPDDSLNTPTDRRMRALRVTMVSSAAEADDAFTRIALSGFQLVGAPWLRRSDRPLSGAAGDSVGATSGYVISSVIGTQDSSATLHYQPPPGVLEQPETKAQLAYDNTVQQNNEHSLRLQAGVPGGQFPVFNRAESYYRFPQGNSTFMGYRTLRLWMRGRGNGWGSNGELNAFVKVGRDENNFYMYRTPVQSGETVAAWDPEVRVDLTRFQALRAELENNTLRNAGDSLACSGADLELIRRSGLPRGIVVRRYAVCQNGYIVYSADPGITPPNLAGVQEMAVGFVRVDSMPRGANGIVPGDTLELWVDDVRLSDVVANMGFAGELGLFGNAGDLADFRLNLTRRDPHFRQLGENPTFLTSAGVSAGTTVHLERMLPRSLGLLMPFTINHGSTSVEQQFINQTDVLAEGIRGLRSPRDSRTDYSLAVRRATPISGAWFAPLVNGLSLTALWGKGNGRSSFQAAASTNYAFNAALNIDGLQFLADTAPAHLPRLFDLLLGALPSFLRESEAVRGLRAQNLRWRPSRFQLLSGVARTANTTTSFLNPVEIPEDSGVSVQTQLHLWQNSSTLEFRPLNAITASFTARQTFDLRNYANSATIADSVNRAAAIRAEHVSLFGADLGLERERAFAAYLDFRPGITRWLQPAFGFRSDFSLYKDPNARSLLRDASDSSRMQLPRRLGALQTLTASLMLDFAGLLEAHSTDSSHTRRLGRALLPLNVGWNRLLTSNYDNTFINPGVGYQLGVVGVQSFRGLNTQLATGAGRLSNINADAGFRLPLSLTFRTSLQHSNAETWTRRVLDNFQALITSENTTYPNAELGWNLTLATPNKLFSAVSASVRYVRTENNTVVLSETGSVVEANRSESESQPMSLQINWMALTGFRTAVVLGRSHRVDSRPGTETRSDNPLSQSYQIGKEFPLPESWKTKSRLRTSVSYVSDGAISVVQDAPSPNSLFISGRAPSILTDNGRRQFNFQADTDLSESLSFSVTGSHTVAFDRNYNRQNSLTVFSTVLQLHFGSGGIR